MDILTCSSSRCSRRLRPTATRSSRSSGGGARAPSISLREPCIRRSTGSRPSGLPDEQMGGSWRAAEAGLQAHAPRAGQAQARAERLERVRRRSHHGRGRGPMTLKRLPRRAGPRSSGSARFAAAGSWPRSRITCGPLSTTAWLPTCLGTRRRRRSGPVRPRRGPRRGLQPPVARPHAAGGGRRAGRRGLALRQRPAPDGGLLPPAPWPEDAASAAVAWQSGTAEACFSLAAVVLALARPGGPRWSAAARGGVALVALALAAAFDLPLRSRTRRSRCRLRPRTGSSPESSRSARPPSLPAALLLVGRLRVPRVLLT